MGTGLFGGKVLTEASLHKMTTPYKNDYAFGLVVSEHKGKKVIQHGGGIEGFNTALAYYPDDKLIVIALANLKQRGRALRLRYRPSERQSRCPWRR